MSARIVQLTDCHLLADPLSQLKGICTRSQFDRVLETVHARFADADRLIVTGDLTHDGLPTTYETLRSLLADWFPRLRVIPGNHDDRPAMREIFGARIQDAAGRHVFVDDVGDWILIGLDSLLPGEVRGALGVDQLAWLKSQLRLRPQKPTCLFLHHPPVRVNSAWLDQIGLEDAAALRDILHASPQVRAVSCGHVHQERTTIEGSLVVLTSPSTGVQFRPETEVLEVDSAAPGFRVIDLESDGQVRSWIERA